MSVMDQLRRVGCVSVFEGQEIDDVLLSTIVESASWAPSAANAQPWEIIAVRNSEQKAAIVETLLDSHLRPGVGGHERRAWVAEAPLLLVICLDHMRAKVRYGEIGEKQFGIQDTGAAIQNIRLVALERGVKSCLIREFDQQQMAELLELPRHVRPLTMIVMGYSQEESRSKPRLLMEDYLHFEKW